jgi:hypothetical protein
MVDRVSTSLGPLAKELPAERRDLVEALRPVFLRLGVSVRRYALTKSFDPGTVSRYLNGTRLPTWKFIAGVIADNERNGEKVTAEVAELLKRLHGQAEQVGSPRERAVRSLEDQLLEADGRARGAQEQARALVEEIQQREQNLAELERALLAARREGEEAKQAYGKALERWQDRYHELCGERDRLLGEVRQLQAELAWWQREAETTEDRCTELEQQLEQAERLADSTRLLRALEETPRSAPVPELVSLIGSLETSERKSVAMELVQSALRLRPASDIPELLSALRSANLQQHAEIALPAIVMVMPVPELVGMCSALELAGMDITTVLVVSVRVRSPQEQREMAVALCEAGLAVQAGAMVAAVGVDRPVPHVLALLAELAGAGLGETVRGAMPGVARNRGAAELAALIVELHREGVPELARVLLTVAGADRTPRELAQLLGALNVPGCRAEVEEVLAQTVVNRSVGELGVLIPELIRAGLGAPVGDLLTAVLRGRPPEQVAQLFAVLQGAGGVELARLLGALVELRSLPELAQVLAELGRRPGLLDDLLGRTHRYHAGQLATLAVALPADRARWLLGRVAINREAPVVLDVLRRLGEGPEQREWTEAALTVAAQQGFPSRVAELAGELAAAGLPEWVELMVAAVRAGSGQHQARVLPLLAERGLVVPPPVAPQPAPAAAPRQRRRFGWGQLSG